MPAAKRQGYGVELRPNSIRLKIYIDGVCHRPTLTLNGKPMAPTAGNRQYAERQGAAIAKAIDAGTFSWAEFFPDSPQAKEQGQADAAPVQTFGEVAAAWLKTKGQHPAATRGQYALGIGIWTRILGADTPMSALTYQVLATKIGSEPWASTKSQNNYMTPLRGVFAFHFHGPRSTENPLLSIRNPKHTRKPPDPLTTEERDRVLADMRTHYDPRIVAYFTFAFYTGMRPEEMIALRWSDVDRSEPGKAYARVQRVRTFRGAEREGDKIHRTHDVDLVAPALEALKLMEPYTLMLRDEDGSEPDLFQDPITGKGFNSDKTQRERYWKPSLLRLRMRMRRAYATRHTYATAALMRGVPPAYIARQLGHVNSQMVHQTYTRWIDGADSGHAQRLMEAAMSTPPAEAAPLPPGTRVARLTRVK